MMAYYEIDAPVVPVLLFEVRPAKQEYEGDVYDEGGGCERERESGTSPSDIEYANERHVRRSSDGDRQGRDDFVVAGATGQGEAAIELQMREGAPPNGARSTLYRDPGSQYDYTRT